MTAESIGYRIVLPPGWAQIPLLSGTDEAIDALLDAVGADGSERREEVAARLREAAAEARNTAGVHLYLPVVARYGGPIAVSFVVADLAFGSLDPLDPGPLVARLARGPEAGRVIVDGVVGSRDETTHPADPGRGMPVASRRVDYVLPVPDDADRWVVVTFSALETGAAAAADLVELFDAIMGTFRWTHARTTSV